MNKEDRGLAIESYEEHMYRLGKEDKAIDKKKLTALEKQIGGDHYKNCEIMPAEFIYKNKLDFLEGNVIKYITRHKEKDGPEDIKKVIHYAQLILELTYGIKKTKEK